LLGSSEERAEAGYSNRNDAEEARSGMGSRRTHLVHKGDAPGAPPGGYRRKPRICVEAKNVEEGLVNVYDQKIIPHVKRTDDTRSLQLIAGRGESLDSTLQFFLSFCEAAFLLQGGDRA
jgi:hypothetical protein